MKHQYLGNSEETTGWRIYKRKRINGKHEWILVSWIQERCKQCGKFISKNIRIKRDLCLCHECRRKRQYTRQNKWRSMNAVSS